MAPTSVGCSTRPLRTQVPAPTLSRACMTHAPPPHRTEEELQCSQPRCLNSLRGCSPVHLGIKPSGRLLPPCPEPPSPPPAAPLLLLGGHLPCGPSTSVKLVLWESWPRSRLTREGQHTGVVTNQFLNVTPCAHACCAAQCSSTRYGAWVHGRVCMRHCATCIC